MNFLVFPGQASQYPGMGKEWFENFKAAKETFEEASDSCSLNLKKLCFDGTDADLKATEITQPAILTTSIAIWRSLAELTDLEKLKTKSLFAGHSLGEYSALVAMGALELAPTASFVHKRGKAMQEAVPEGEGGMLALLFKPRTEGTLEIAEEICEKARKLDEGGVWLANINGDAQMVLAGKAEAVRHAQIIATEGEYPVRQAVALDVSAPFHSPMMEKAADNLKGLIDDFEVKGQEGLRYIANVDAKDHDLLDGAALKSRLLEQICSPVLWWQSAQKALSLGAERVIEVGPKKVLSSMTKRITLEGKKFEAFNIDLREDWEHVQANI